MRAFRRTTPGDPRSADQGYTLVEVALSLVFIGLMGTGIASLYLTGLDALDARNAEMQVNSLLRGRMEWILSRDFDLMVNGSDTVTVNGVSATLTWTATAADLDGDSVPEATVKLVTVTLGSKSLYTIVADNEDRIGKI